MATGKRRKEERQRLLRELEASGLSVAQFAREHGLSAWTIYEWRRKRRDEEQRAAGEQPTFVRVSLRAEPLPPPAMAVEVGDQLRVQVPHGFDEAELRRLIGVLSSC